MEWEQERGTERRVKERQIKKRGLRGNNLGCGGKDMIRIPKTFAKILPWVLGDFSRNSDRTNPQNGGLRKIQERFG